MNLPVVNFEVLAQVAFGIFLMAFFVEGTVEYLFAQPMTKFVADADTASQYLHYIALVAGVAAAFGFGLDLTRAIPGLTATQWWVGPLFTGVVIGRGSNYTHDILTRLGSSND